MNDFSCCICYSEYNMTNNLPRIIPNCGHTLCSQCLSSLLRSPKEAKCPLDKNKFDRSQSTLEAFPENVALKALIQNRSIGDVCRFHGEKINSLCLNCQISGCLECLYHQNHDGHKIMPINRAKAKVDVKTTKLKASLEKLEHNYKTLDDLFEKKRIEVSNKVKTMFEQIIHPINEKKIGFLFQINEIFDQERFKLSSTIGPDSQIYTDIKNRIIDQADFLNDRSVFGVLKLDISELIREVRGCNLNNKFEEINKEIDEMISSLSFSTYPHIVTFLENIEHSFEEFSNRMESIVLPDYSQNQPGSYNTIFDFKLKGNRLLVSNIDTPSEILIQNTKKEFKKIQEMDLNISNLNLNTEDFDFLDGLISSAKNLSSIKISVNCKMPNEKSLENLWLTVLRGVDKLESLEIDTESCQITEKTVSNLINELLPQAKEIKSMNLKMSSTAVSDTVKLNISQNLLPWLKSAQTFAIDLRDTCITDKGEFKKYSYLI